MTYKELIAFLKKEQIEAYKLQLECEERDARMAKAFNKGRVQTLGECVALLTEIGEVTK